MGDGITPWNDLPWYNKNFNIVNGNAEGSLHTIGSPESRQHIFDELGLELGIDYDEDDIEYTMGEYAFAEGKGTTASGEASHSEGVWSTASGEYSHAEGIGTVASRECSHTQGSYNIIDRKKEYLHIVGNGTAGEERSNAHTLDWEGNAWYSGLISCLKEQEIEKFMLNTNTACFLSCYLYAPFYCPIYLGKLKGKIDLLSFDENNETILKLTNSSLPINECFDMDKIQVNISLTDNMIDNYIEDIMVLNMIPKSNGKIKFLNLPTENILDKLIAIDVVVDIMYIGGNQQ